MLCQYSSVEYKLEFSGTNGENAIKETETLKTICVLDPPLRMGNTSKHFFFFKIIREAFKPVCYALLLSSINFKIDPHPKKFPSGQLTKWNIIFLNASGSKMGITVGMGCLFCFTYL